MRVFADAKDACAGPFLLRSGCFSLNEMDLTYGILSRRFQG